MGKVNPARGRLERKPLDGRRLSQSIVSGTVATYNACIFTEEGHHVHT